MEAKNKKLPNNYIFILVIWYTLRIKNHYSRCKGFIGWYSKGSNSIVFIG